MKRKLIPVIVGAVLIGVLVPVLIGRQSGGPGAGMKDLSIAEVWVVVEDAYGWDSEYVRPGQRWQVTRGANIIADISVTRERAVIRTEDGEYHLSFATGDVSGNRIVKGTQVKVYLMTKTWEECLRDTRIIPLEGLSNGNHWITLRWADKRQHVEVVLDFEPELRAGTSKPVDDIVAMLNTFYDKSQNRDRSLLSALRQLILG